MYKCLLNTVRLYPIYTYLVPMANASLILSQRSNFLHEVPGQENGGGHHGNAGGAHGHRGREAGHGKVVLLVIQLLVRMLLKLQDLHVEAKSYFGLGRLLAPN